MTPNEPALVAKLPLLKGADATARACLEQESGGTVLGWGQTNILWKAVYNLFSGPWGSVIRLPIKHWMCGNQGETWKARHAASMSILRGTHVTTLVPRQSSEKWVGERGWVCFHQYLGATGYIATIPKWPCSAGCNTALHPFSLGKEWKSWLLNFSRCVCLISAASQRKAGIQSGQQKGSSGAEHSLLLSEALFSKTPQYKDSKANSVKNEQKLSVARKDWNMATHKKRKR